MFHSESTGTSRGRTEALGWPSNNHRGRCQDAKLVLFSRTPCPLHMGCPSESPGGFKKSLSLPGLHPRGSDFIGPEGRPSPGLSRSAFLTGAGEGVNQM